MPKGKLLFLTLNTFSSTGGIEKVCQVAGKALSQLCHEQNKEFALYSLNDGSGQLDERYVRAESFFGFAGSKLRFIMASIRCGRKSETVVLSHIHLLLVGIAIKLVSPTTKIVLIAHGIEVWKQLPTWKKNLLKKLHLILPVSEFTRHKMLALYSLEKNKLVVVNNCLDPFLQKQTSPSSLMKFRQKYGLQEDDVILLTLSRLKFSEQYKGYDRVIKALPEVLKIHPKVSYFIAGKYDAEEKNRLDNLIDSLDLQDKVLFSGFLPDNELGDCLETASVYIMPSTGEGFGIVFIEAMFYGKPVIAGNVDGSVDALAQGKLGLLINPYDLSEISAAVCNVLSNQLQYTPKQTELLAKFGFSAYTARLREVLFSKPDSQ